LITNNLFLIPFCRFANIHLKMETSGFTKLHIASSGKSVRKFQEGLKKSADVNARAICQRTPLHIAAKSGNGNFVKILLERGAQVDAQDLIGRTPLFNAVRSGDLECVVHILSCHPNRRLKWNKDAFLHSITDYDFRKYQSIVKAFVEHGFKITRHDSNNADLFSSAMENRHCDIVESFFLLEGSLMPFEKASDSGLLFDAVVDLNMTRLLLKYGADVKKYPKILFRSLDVDDGISKETTEIVRELLDHGANIEEINWKDKTILYRAIEKNALDVARLLLERGANVNAQSVGGWAPLHVAAKNGLEEAVDLCLEFGADVNLKSKYGDDRNCDDYDFIWDDEDDLHEFYQTVVDGSTPLHIAAYGCNYRIVIQLLKHGANMNAVDRNGKTPAVIAGMKFFYCEDYAMEMIFYDDYTAFWRGMFRQAYGNDDDDNFEDGDDVDSDVVDLNESDDDIFKYNIFTDLNSCCCERRRCCSGDQTLVFGILLKVLIMLKEADFPLYRTNLQAIKKMKGLEIGAYFQRFTKRCRAEVEIIKKTKVPNTNVSYFDLITKPKNERAQLALNKDVVDILATIDIKYPCYGPMIETEMFLSQKRGNLLKKWEDGLYFSGLPFHCILNVCKYLRDNDLKNVIDAYLDKHKI